MTGPVSGPYWWLECPLACPLVNSRPILTAFYACLIHFTTGSLVVWLSPCLSVCQDQARGTWRWKPLNAVLTVNSCGKQVMMSPSPLSHMSRISSAPKLAHPWAMTVTCYWLDKTFMCTGMLKNIPRTPQWQEGKMLTCYVHTLLRPLQRWIIITQWSCQYLEIQSSKWYSINNIISISPCVNSNEATLMWT